MDKEMIVNSCDTVSDIATIFTVDGELPPWAFAIKADGVQYRLVPNYGYTEHTLSIMGAHELLGKRIEIVSKDERGNLLNE